MPPLFEAQRRHAVHYADVLGAVTKLYQKDAEGVEQALGLFDQEWPNIEAAFHWCTCQISRDDAIARLAMDYTTFAYCLNLRLHPQERVKWFTVGRNTARRLGDREAEGINLVNLSYAYLAMGQISETIECSDQALRVAQEIADRRIELSSVGNLGIAYRTLGQIDQSVTYYEQAFDIAQQIGDQAGEERSLSNLGNAYSDLGQLGKAEEYHQKALTLAQARGNRLGEGRHLSNLSDLYIALDDTESALDACQEALTIARELGDRQ